VRPQPGSFRPSVVALVVVIAAAGLSGCGDGASDRAADTERKANAAAEEAVKANARAERDAAVEGARLASLWTYSQVPAGQGKQVAASIRSANDVDTDGKGPRSVLLVFRDHPAWGRSSYLVLTAGDFRCSPRCIVSVQVDDAAPRSVAAHRPKTDEAIAMFIDDARALWRATAETKRISIEFPVKAGGTRTASYDVAGLDRSRMPGWDMASTTNDGRQR
jgi:hypothetical protein